jgi:hypothetical protein
MQVPAIREVYTTDDFVKGKVKKYEVVDALDGVMEFEPVYSAYTEREALTFIVDWFDG